MLTYVASIPLSTRSLTRLSELIRARRAALGGRWRRLPAHEQALMTLAHLRNGDTLARLAVGFAVSISTRRPGPGVVSGGRVSVGADGHSGARTAAATEHSRAAAW